QLVREHIAGDLLQQPRWNKAEGFNESVIGTAFYRFGEVNHDDCIALREIGFDLADNQIDTLTKAFQATTVACARCHDHKLDAISMRDYYGLLGILRSSRMASHTIDAPEVNAPILERLRALKTALRAEIAAAWTPEVRQVARYMEAAAAGHDQERLEFNRARFVDFADFRSGRWGGWELGGQGLRDLESRSGDFVVQAGGDRLLAAVLPAGCFTHRLSAKLNGTIRSPVLP